jgi:hypothetical protein
MARKSSLEAAGSMPSEAFGSGVDSSGNTDLDLGGIQN